jgi:hypothetical protein
MVITFDPVKRAKNLHDRQLDFLDAEIVLSGPVFTVENPVRLRRATFSDGRISRRSYGDGGMDPARRSRACNVDEEVQ